MIHLSGFLLISKPIGITSFDAIRAIKKLLPPKTKIGHAGTLDPFASGLLIVAITRDATRHISPLMKLDKKYQATGKLGQLTDTLDHTGTTIASHEYTGDAAQIIDAIAHFGTEYDQIPPAYSALKIDGQPLYVYARQLKNPDIELQEILKNKQRRVHIHDLQLISHDQPTFSIQAHVSHGTYIRTLVNDIAKKIDTYATTIALVRTQIGPFRLDAAHDLHSITSPEDLQEALIPVEQFLAELSTYTTQL